MWIKRCYPLLSKISALLITLFVAACQNEKLSLTEQRDLRVSKDFEETLLETDAAEKKQKILDGMQALRQKDFKGASRLFNEVLIQDPTNSGLHTLNGLAYQSMAQNGDFSSYDLAEAGYQQAKKFNSQNIFAALQLGRVKVAKQDYIGAQEEFANVLLLDPSHQDALYELASASYLAGDVRTAQMCVDAVLKKDPGKPEYVRAGALIYAVQGDKEKASHFVNSYKAMEPQAQKQKYLEKRVKEWLNLHDSGKVVLVAANTTPEMFAQTTATASSAPSIQMQAEKNKQPAEMITVPSISATSTDSTESQSTVSPPPSLLKPSPPLEGMPSENMIVVDAVVLRIMEEAHTIKGNNILDNFTMTLSPYTKYFANNAGSAITDARIFPLNNTSTLPTTTGTLIPGAVTSMLPNAGHHATLITGGISFGAINYALNIANASREHIEIIGRPTLTTSVGSPAKFFAGEEIYIALQGSFGGGNVTKTPTGTTLEITPLKVENDYITLKVEVIDSFLEESQNTIAARAATLTPLVFSVNNSAAHGTLKMKLGETIMLAGFIERTELYSNSGFPFLKEIPLLQYFFSRDTTSSLRVSVMYLITPRSQTDVRKLATDFLKAKASGRPNLAEIEGRYKSWLSPGYNVIPVMKSLSDLSHDFRRGDFLPLRWGHHPEYAEIFDQISEFVWFSP